MPRLRWLAIAATIAVMWAAASAQIDAPSSPITADPESQSDGLINLDDIAVQMDADMAEADQPDDVDNDAIQKLVDQFLNNGTLTPDKNKKVNKEAQALVNSSPYWDTKELEERNGIKNAAAASKWLEGYNVEAAKVLQQVAIAAWNYFTAASHITKQNLDEAEDVARQFLKAAAKQALQYDQASITDPIIRKQFSIIEVEGMNALDMKSFGEYTSVLGEINRVYTGVDVCAKDQKMCIKKYPDLIAAIRQATDSDEALQLWKLWRSTVGQNLTKSYEQLVKVTNKAAQLNGYADAGQMWRAAFDQNADVSHFEMANVTEDVYMQILPFYSQLHAYFRRQLAAVYRNDTDLSRDSMIPAHLLRSSTGDEWSAAYEETKPFDQMDKLPEEVVDNLHRLNVTAKQMFAKTYRYMRYLGLPELPKNFWSRSVFARIWSKDMICQPATAYDMMNGTDIRIKVCAQIAQPDFANSHRLFAQLYYKLLSHSQPLNLRDAPIPQLSGAVANAFGILSNNLDYLKSQHLASVDDRLDKAALINSLYRDALTDIVRIPFAMAADQWRYEVFEGKIKSDNWSERWWKLREKYQGVMPSASAAAEAKFDAVVAAEITQQHAPAARHWVQQVIQFQILKALCAHSAMPLSEGCIPKKAAAEKLAAIMAKGATISWMDALEEFTGSRKLDASALMEYYEPLVNWLSDANEQEAVFIGWDGEGTKFEEQEIPKVRSDSVLDKPSIPSDDQVAYPGGSCTRGEECLLDSHCNGTMCVCNENLFTLILGDTYSCVQNDPANVGFGGPLINLAPNEPPKTTESPKTEKPKTPIASGAQTVVSVFGVLLGMLSLLLL